MKTIPMDGTLSKIAAFLKKCFRSTNKNTDVDEVDKSTSTSEVVQASSNEPNDLSDDKAYNTTQDTNVADIDVTDVDVNPTTFEVAQASSKEPNHLADDKAYNTTQYTDVNEVDKSTSTSEVVQASSNEPNDFSNNKVYNTIQDDVTDIDSETQTIVKALQLTFPQAYNHSNTNLIGYVQEIISQVELSSPPGIAGKICLELEEYEHRPIPELRPLVALGVLSMTNYKQSAYMGGSLNFQGIGIAPSSAGKEAHISFSKKLLESIGLSDKIASKPKSDKNIYVDIIEAEYLLYSFDEVHSFFKQATNKNAAAFEAGMVSVLLEISTSEHLYLPSKTRDELLLKYETIEQNLNDAGKLTENQKLLLEKAHRLNDRLINGWADPFLSLVGYSTPINLDVMFNEHNIEQGLIGRFMFLRASTQRRKYTGRTLSKPSNSLVNRLKNILHSEDEITISTRAEETLKVVFDYLELDEHLNHPKLGAVYARGFKWITLVSSLLASEESEIQHEHICYATKLFMYNIQSCEVVISGNSELELELLAKAELLALRYTSDQGIGRGVLASKMINCCAQIAHYRKKRKDIAHSLIDQLLIKGVITVEGAVIKKSA